MASAMSGFDRFSAPITASASACWRLADLTKPHILQAIEDWKLRLAKEQGDFVTDEMRPKSMTFERTIGALSQASLPFGNGPSDLWFSQVSPADVSCRPFAVAGANRGLWPACAPQWPRRYDRPPKRCCVAKYRVRAGSRIFSASAATRSISRCSACTFWRSSSSRRFMTALSSRTLSSRD